MEMHPGMVEEQLGSIPGCLLVLEKPDGVALPKLKAMSDIFSILHLRIKPNYINMLGKFGKQRDGVVWREEGAITFSGQNRDCNIRNNVETITSWQGWIWQRSADLQKQPTRQCVCVCVCVLVCVCVCDCVNVTAKNMQKVGRWKKNLK